MFHISIHIFYSNPHLQLFLNYQSKINTFFINVNFHIKISMKTSEIFSVNPKRFRARNRDDKQNQQANSNRDEDLYSHIKSNVKTGVQIRNKVKNKKLTNQTIINKKAQSRKNHHLFQKMQKLLLQNKKVKNHNSCNLSSTSSTKSLKSVTFSVNSNSEHIGSSQNKKKSILKNKFSQQNKLANSEKKSLASSLCSRFKSQDQSKDSQSSNAIILEKYMRIVKQLKINHQKYTDPIYPPCEESIFLKNKSIKDFLTNLNSEGYKIKWLRLGQIYKGDKVCVWHPQAKSRVTRGFINSSCKQNSYMQTVLNCINKKYLMEKFFQSQTVSDSGIYYVKMHQTQTNTWKYVIIDDFIPVLVSNRRQQQKIIKPAFLNVQSDNGVVQIWPYLVQKVFAKYYSTYDSLVRGTTLDFLEEVTGNFYQTIQLKPAQEIGRQQKIKINQKFNNQFNILLAQTPDGSFYPFRSSHQDIQILDTENQYLKEVIKREEFSDYFSKVHVIQANKFVHHKNCLIKQQNLLQKQSPEEKKPFILRAFSLQQSSLCLIALIQKQQKFHRALQLSKDKKHYGYSWMRMILVMKQTTGYRWIQSAYSNDKTLKIQSSLEPGQYFLILLPEWDSKPYDLNLTLFSNLETRIERKTYTDHPHIIEESCMDLAQRKGRLIQINSNICAYNFIDYKTGFIIENINNQKSSGQVKILRTIDGLQDYSITPVNRDFLDSKRLQIKIKSLQSYTVVLKVTGGADRAFLEQFDFGS